MVWNNIIQTMFVNKNNVSEIETNGSTSLFVKIDGKRIEYTNAFSSERIYENSIIELIRMIDPTVNTVPKFLFEGKLKIYDKSKNLVTTARCHIVLPPISDSPQVTIAKKTTNLTTLESIHESGSINIKTKNFLSAAIDLDLTTVLSGASGSGKTTFLEALTKKWNNNLRIGVAEDSPELNLIQKNVTYLKSNPWKPGQDKNEEANLDWAVQQLNRMRVDKIIVGETRSKEFFYFLQAANSGCEGSLTTIHASSPKMCLQKMSQFTILAMPQPVRTANQSIANTIDLIIQLTRFPNGSYKLVSIEEVTEVLSQGDSASIATTPLIQYNPKTNVWEDNFNKMSDKLKNKLIEHNYNINSFEKITRKFK